MRVAAIDAGTNTFRLLIADIKNNEFTPVYSERVIVRLGEGLIKGTLQGKPLNKAITTLKLFSLNLKKYKVEKINCAGTEIFRKAGSINDIINLIKNETGIKLKVISGEEEGMLTLKGVLSTLKPNFKNSIIIDIGGGSTEFIFCKDNKAESIESIDFGVVFFAKKIKRFTKEIDGLVKYKNLFLKEIANKIKNVPFEKHQVLIGTAGTVTTVAAVLQELKKYAPEKINNFLIKREMLENLKGKLLKIPMNERGRISGVEEGRKDLILPGIFMLEAIFDFFNSQKVLVSDGGILEGLLFE